MKQGEINIKKRKRPTENWLDQRLRSEALDQTNHSIEPHSLIPKPFHSGNELGNGGDSDEGN